jgi:hypothetical protein
MKALIAMMPFVGLWIVIAAAVFGWLARQLKG